MGLQWRVIAAFLIGFLSWTAGHTPAYSQTYTPAWLEPKGLSVVDLTGLVPASHLQNSIVAASRRAGILEYMEGTRAGDLVTIRVKVTPRYELDGRAYFNCLGLRGFSDHWSLAVPASAMRLYQGAEEITQEITQLDYSPSGLTQPVAAGGPARYVEIGAAPLDYSPDGELLIPANIGCTLTLNEPYDNLTAVFRFLAPQLVIVNVLGSETFSFSSYSGPGYPGRLGALQQQLRAYIGDRHDKLHIHPPEETDYVLLNFPATPVSPGVDGDVETNIRNPSSGTYRLAFFDATLSVDHNISMGLPLYGQWLDMDLDTDGGPYLPELRNANVLSGLEYFVPVGVAYDPCMVTGNCPEALLKQIADTKMEMTLYYYRVERVAHGLVRVPLRQVGRDWTPASPTVAGRNPSGSAMHQDVPVKEHTVVLPPGRSYLPAIWQSELIALPADNSEGCPCGWFTAGGRMVDFIPAAPEPARSGRDE
jgi:hypothetical protein